MIDIAVKKRIPGSKKLIGGEIIKPIYPYFANSLNLKHD